MKSWIVPVVLGILLFPSLSAACSCSGPFTVEKQLQIRSSIFLGTVTGITMWEGEAPTVTGAKTSSSLAIGMS